MLRDEGIPDGRGESRVRLTSLSVVRKFFWTIFVEIFGAGRPWPRGRRQRLRYRTQHSTIPTITRIAAVVAETVMPMMAAWEMLSWVCFSSGGDEIGEFC